MNERPKRTLFSLLILLPISIVLITLGTGYALLRAANPSTETRTITGAVVDKSGPVVGVSVRLPATEQATETDKDGKFVLSVDLPQINSAKPITIVAWAEGYFFGLAPIPADESLVIIQLKRHHNTDNLDYAWEPSENCAECHPSYSEWRADAHSQSAQNHRFLSMYSGTDIDGNRGRGTNYYLGLPRELDPDKPYYGPGFKLDFPQRDGSCATCHTPLASNLATDNTCAWSGCHLYVTAERSDEIDESVSPLGLMGVANEGISCDFCHKIGDVRLEPDTGLPHTDNTGILALELYRPAPDERFFMGSIDDVARDTDSFNPLHKKSEFCAGCHTSSFNQVLVYNSYGEWLDSPYSGAQDGQSCQDCHMPIAEQYNNGFQQTVAKTFVKALPKDSSDLPPLLAAFIDNFVVDTQKNYFVYPEKDGLYRAPEQVHNHTMPGASDLNLLQNAVTMETEAQRDGNQLSVTVRITNDQAGHHVPTGSPLRHIMLVVQATDEAGNSLALQSGSLLPEWAGNYAQQPGKGFAKILQDTLTGEEPTFAHWRNITMTLDSRIPALAMDVTEYTFDAPEQGQIQVETRLIFRRAFQQLAEWKGWNDPDILMEVEKVSLN